MKFHEAMKELEDGKKIRLFHWDKYEYIYINSQNYVVDEVSKSYEIDRVWDNWELYEEPVKTYTFQEIIPFLKKCKKVKRNLWIKEYFIYKGPDGKIMSTFRPSGFSGIQYTGFEIEDIEADDWTVVE